MATGGASSLMVARGCSLNQANTGALATYEQHACIPGELLSQRLGLWLRSSSTRNPVSHLFWVSSVVAANGVATAASPLLLQQRWPHQPPWPQHKAHWAEQTPVPLQHVQHACVSMRSPSFSASGLVAPQQQHEQAYFILQVLEEEEEQPLFFITTNKCRR